MRVREYFCQDEAIGRLLVEFRMSQGPLFHYSDRIAASGIRNGKIWMTRADCFLDPREIGHGLEVLSLAARSAHSELEGKQFLDALEALRARLRSSYVLSLSLDPESDYLKTNYAGADGVALEFESTFPHLLYNLGYHAESQDGGSFRRSFVVDVYDLFEGFVVYDKVRQHRLAAMACLAHSSLVSASSHPVDVYHFINVLVQCLILFKSQEFAAENEYRVALVQQHGITESFEKTRDCRGRRSSYIEVSVPPAVAAAIHAHNL